jgi:hypothetical protein
MASKEVVVVDADVLIPVLACDFLLTGLDLAIYELAVSRIVLDEVERHLLADFPGQDPARLAVRAQQMRFALRNSVVRDAKPTEAVDTVNTKDRHVAMAAITSRANVAGDERSATTTSAHQRAPEVGSHEHRPVRTPPISTRR